MLGPRRPAWKLLILSLLFPGLQEPEPPDDDDAMLLKCLETFDDL